MHSQLFRAEVLARQQEGMWGGLVLSRPLPGRLLTLFLTVLTVVSLTVLVLNSYARKATVRGMLVPDSGLITVTTPASGLIENVHVREGEQVESGTILVTLQIDHNLGNSDARSMRMAAALQEQKANLQARLAYFGQQQQLINQQHWQQQQQLESSLHHVHLMQAREAEVLNIRLRALQRAQELEQAGYLAQADHDAVQLQLLEQEKLLTQLDQQEAELRAGLAALPADFDSRRLDLDQQMAALGAELAALQRQQVQLDTETATVIRAPVQGRVSSMDLHAGMPVANGQDLLSVVPAGARLVAVLEVSSAAVGFVQSGQDVSMRIDAFPYQKFGMLQGTVIQLAGSAREQQALPGQEALSAYRILVRPEAQTITAYGVEQELLAGMQLSADVVLDRRTLLEWLLEPLFSITGAGGSA